MNESVQTTGRPSKRYRVARYLLPLVMLGLAVHVILPQIATWQHSLEVIKAMPWWAVTLAVLAQVLSYLGSGYLMRAIVAVVGQRLPVVRGTIIFTAATSVGLAGGGPVGSIATTYRWTRGSGVGAEGATLAGWLPALFYDGSEMLIAIFGLIHLLILHQLSTSQAIAFAAILLVLLLLVAAVVWGTQHWSHVGLLAARLARWWAKVRHRSYDATTTEAATNRWFSAFDALRRGGWRGPALGALLNTTFDILTLYFLFIAAGHPVSPGILLSGYGLPLLLGKLSFLPGGVGIVEATMTALYNSLGVPSAVTVIVVLIYRFLSFWLPLLIGFPLVPYLQHVAGEANELPQDGR